jgi:hypothetical protein
MRMPRIGSYIQRLEAGGSIGWEVTMTDIAKMESYCTEVREIVSDAERIIHLLNQVDICEGHRLMAAQAVVAIRRLCRIIELHHNRLLVTSVIEETDLPNPTRLSWLSLVRHRFLSTSRAVETRA